MTDLDFIDKINIIIRLMFKKKKKMSRSLLEKRWWRAEDIHWG